jgi:hypothetical protein
MTYNDEHPADNSLSREAWWRMHQDPRFITGRWSETDWLWEEVRQLTSAIRMKEPTVTSAHATTCDAQRGGTCNCLTGRTGGGQAPGIDPRD